MGAGVAEKGSAAEGPVQRRLLQLVSEYSSELGFSTGVAARSRLGPCTFTLRALNGGEVDLEEVAAWLGRQPGVDLVALKGPHLHIRLQTDALRAWFCDGWREAPAAPAHEPQPMTVTMPEEDSPRSLDWSRKAAVARSVAALLEEQGHIVGVETSTEEHISLWGMEPSAEPNGPLPVDVAQVDTRHDRLRARHGGILTLEDLRGDICEDAITLEGRKRSEQYADALVSYLLTQVPRERRLGLDDQMVREKQAELDEILALRDLAKETSEAEATGTPKLSAAAEATVRTLIGEVESAAGVSARADKSRDPAPVNRLLRSLAQGMRAAEDDLPEGDMLWTASLETLEGALRLAAPGISEGSLGSPVALAG